MQISLSDFPSRLGPVRGDRDPGAHLFLTLQILPAADASNLTLRIQDMKRSPYWDVETIEWPLRGFAVRTVEGRGLRRISGTGRHAGDVAIRWSMARRPTPRHAAAAVSTTIEAQVESVSVD